MLEWTPLVLSVFTLRPSAGSLCHSSRVLQGALEDHIAPTTTNAKQKPLCAPQCRSPLALPLASVLWARLRELRDWSPFRLFQQQPHGEHNTYFTYIYVQSAQALNTDLHWWGREHSIMAGHRITRHLNSSVDIAVDMMFNVQNWLYHTLKDPHAPQLGEEREDNQ